MHAPHVTPKKSRFYVMVDALHKFLVPMAPNKTVHDLIEAVKHRLRKKCCTLSSYNNAKNGHLDNESNQPILKAPLDIDIDSLTTMYWVDAQSLKPKHIYVILEGSDMLQKILNIYKFQLSTNKTLKEFFWYLTSSPSTYLNIPNLKPAAIAQVPNEIRAKYHRLTPFLYPGFYFNFFIAKKYHGPNHQEKRKQIELYRQQRLQSKYHLNSPSPSAPNHIQYNTNSNHSNNDDSSNNQHNIKTNNRGRYVTANAMNEIIHHQQHKNEIIMKNELHWFPKQSLVNDMNNIAATYKHRDAATHKHNESDNDHRLQIDSDEFNEIPSYLQDTMCNNDKWSYLYHSFDFKYIMILCFVCRCLVPQDALTPAHYLKLGESALLRQLTDEEFDICIEKSKELNCDNVKETIAILTKQNDNYYVNFERMIVYDCLVHLVSDGVEFERNRLQILRICSQFGTVNGLTSVEIACIIQMFLTESQLLNVYRQLF